MSLKESGKSRADLWQLAANTAINIAIADANQACDDPGRNAETLLLEYFTLSCQPISNCAGHKQQQVVATEGRDRCDFKLDQPVPFMSGRIDCQPDPAKKWTPFDFEATEVERQSNPRGTGNQVEYESFSDVGEIRVYFASKILTPCRMH